MNDAVGSRNSEAAVLYLDLLKKCLTYYLWGGELKPVDPIELREARRWFRRSSPLEHLRRKGIEFVRRVPFDSEIRREGKDWPVLADTMIGLKRLDNLQQSIESVLRDGIPGDFIETGVWRGGATIFMRAVLKAYGVTDRTVWVADSFEGLPPPDTDNYPQDADDTHHTLQALQVSMEDVQANFSKYGLLDDKVRFLKGWFKDTLPTASIERLSIIRLDGDMYESTMDGLKNLYPKLSVGGYVIVDDYGYWDACRRAVHNYRDANDITEPIHKVDWTGVYWRREK